MKIKKLIYNLIIMKKTILLIISMVIFSGCASYEFTKKTYSKNPNFKFSGGVLHFGIEYNEINEEKVSKIITDFCSERDFKKISIETAKEYNWLLIIPWDHKDYKLEFECIDEKK